MCSGNNCRAPTAEVVFRELAERAGIGERFAVTSRGTEGYHVGEGADPRALRALASNGYDGSAHRAARLGPADIAENELLVALAREHERAILALGADPERVALLSGFDPERPADPDVFDPYYSDQRAYDEVLVQIERSCAALLTRLTRT